jgi:hypothetical protein
MARYGATLLSQANQLAGVNATTTVNGYLGYWGASATAGYRLRRLQLGVIAGASRADLAADLRRRIPADRRPGR